MFCFFSSTDVISQTKEFYIFVHSPVLFIWTFLFYLYLVSAWFYRTLNEACWSWVGVGVVTTYDLKEVLKAKTEDETDRRWQDAGRSYETGSVQKTATTGEEEKKIMTTVILLNNIISVLFLYAIERHSRRSLHSTVVRCCCDLKEAITAWKTTGGGGLKMHSPAVLAY